MRQLDIGDHQFGLECPRGVERVAAVGHRLGSWPCAVSKSQNSLMLSALSSTTRILAKTMLSKPCPPADRR